MDFDGAFEGIVAELEPERVYQQQISAARLGSFASTLLGRTIPMITLENGDVVGVPLKLAS